MVWEVLGQEQSLNFLPCDFLYEPSGMIVAKIGDRMKPKVCDFVEKNQSDRIRVLRFMVRGELIIISKNGEA